MFLNYKRQNQCKDYCNFSELFQYWDDIITMRPIKNICNSDS